MSNLVLCRRCETLEKTGIKRRDVFYKESEYCKQCRSEKKQNILDDNLLKTLEEIRIKFGGNNGKSSKSINKSTK